MPCFDCLRHFDRAKQPISKVLLLELERFGCDNKIVSFVLPLGYSFNLDGGMMYMTFASLFLAQAYNMHFILWPEQQLTMLLILMVTSKGIAGVPGLIAGGNSGDIIVV